MQSWINAAHCLGSGVGFGRGVVGRCVVVVCGGLGLGVGRGLGCGFIWLWKIFDGGAELSSLTTITLMNTNGKGKTNDFYISPARFSCVIVIFGL